MKNKIPTVIQPQYIIAIAATIAIIMIVTAYIELNKSKDDLFLLLNKEAYSVAESIGRSSVIVVLSTDEIENILNERLLNNASFIARLDDLGQLSRNALRQLCIENNISSVHIYNKQGEIILSAHNKESKQTGPVGNSSAYELFYPILTGETEMLIIGITESETENGQSYTVAVKRRHPEGGAIELNLNVDNIVELRRSIGIGRLMKEIGDNRGIEYAVLQDTLGIIAASGSIKEMNTIDSDSLLKFALSNDTTVSRVFLTENKEVFEVIRPVIINKETIGIIRIGLAMDEIHAVEARMRQRVVIISLVVFVIGALALIAIVANQNVRISQKKIRSMETFTGNILENMQDAIVTLSADDRITVFNKQAEKLFGINASKVLNKSPHDFTSESIACLQAIFSSDVNMEEIPILCEDKTEHIVSISLTRSDNNTTAVIQDLTETKRLQQEVERQEKLSAMGELAAGVAHEIRNPLNAISMIAQRYEKEFKPVRGIKEYKTITTVLLEETRRVNHIIQQFLRFARPPKLRLSDISAAQLVNHVATLFKGQALSKVVHFNSKCEQDILIRVDKEQITQALLNLLQNALDATSKGGTIILNTIRKEKYVVFQVKDDGDGIPPDRINRIFDLYFTTKNKGTGMGLAITHRIIKQHNGNIEVQSRPGEGTTFIIQIPIR